MNPDFVSSVAVGFQLEVQMLMLLVPALFATVHLMIILHAADVLTAECLSWFVTIARYCLITYLFQDFIFAHLL